jgi:hypothetical protein
MGGLFLKKEKTPMLIYLPQPMLNIFQSTKSLSSSEILRWARG